MTLFKAGSVLVRSSSYFVAFTLVVASLLLTWAAAPALP